MQFTRNQVASFEVGISSMWTARFENLPVNLISNNFPAITVKFGLFEPNNTEIEVGPNYRFKVPVSSKGPSTVELEFYDDDKYTVHSAIAKKVNESPMAKQGRSFISVKNITGSTKSGAINLVVEKYSKSHKLLKTYIMDVWPASPMDFSGDQEFQAIKGSISFDILSFESK